MIDRTLLDALDIYKSIKTFWDYINEKGDVLDEFWLLSDEMGSNIQFRTFVDLGGADRTLAQSLRRFAVKNDIPHCDYEPYRLPTERVCQWDEIKGSSSVLLYFEELPDADSDEYSDEVDLFPDCEDVLIDFCDEVEEYEE